MTRFRTVLQRILFVVPGAVAGLPGLVVIFTYFFVDDPALILLGLGGMLVSHALCFLPAIHRSERSLASELLGTDVDVNAPYRSGVIFASLHLLAGTSTVITVCLAPMALGELLWRLEDAFSGKWAMSTSIDLLVGAVLDSPFRVLLFALFVGASSVSASFLIGCRFLASRVLGKSLEEKLAASEADREKLAVQNELARDIHDSVGHALTIASLQAERGRATVDADRNDAKEALTTILAVCQRAQADLDDVLRVLRTGEPHRSTQVKDLHGIGDLIDEVRDVGLTVDVDIPLNLDVPFDRLQVLYRILQEALTNAVRYAQPRQLSLTIRDEPEGLHIVAENPVDGLTDGRIGKGLPGIEARAHLLGGSSVAGVVAGRFVLDVRIPHLLGVPA
jgi:signal transduction histidine kinase